MKPKLILLGLLPLLLTGCGFVFSKGPPDRSRTDGLIYMHRE
jgi:hypothetical protein